MIPKRILVPERLRRPPSTGWSWLDRRFLRAHGDYLSREAVLLYLFLAAVADRHGLSFYSDHTLSSRLQLSPQALERARQELLERDLIANEVVAAGPGAVAADAKCQPPPSAGPGADPAGRTVPAGGGRDCRTREGRAMNVALWAEIRRLAEIDKLSSRAIARRLHCSRHTVAP